MKTFYRVGNIENNQGLWYDMQGNFTGLIHGKFDFCKNNNLQMPFESECVGYLSAVDDLNDLENWLSKEDMKQLEPFGYRVLEYVSDNYKFHKGHWLINKEKSKLIRIIQE